MGAVGAQIVGGLNDLANAKRAQQNDADMAAFQTEMQKRKQLIDSEIKRIPVQDGVNYRQQADAIVRKHYGELNTWLSKDGNIRNAEAKGVKEMFSQAYKLSEQKVKADAEVYGETYEFSRSKSRYERLIETGIQSGSEEAIKRGYAGRVTLGEIDQNTAATMAESSIGAMNAKLDDDDLSRAEIALHAGDLETYDKTVDGLRLPTQVKKTEMKKKGKASFSYNTANATLIKTETAEGVEQFISGLGEKQAKHASASQRAALDASASGKLRGIKANQHNNAARVMRDAAKGIFDVELFDQMTADDTANGLPRDMVDRVRESATRAAESFHKEAEAKELVKQAKDSEEYKELKSQLTVDLIQPDEFKREKRLSEIEDGKFHPVIEAELMADFLRAAKGNLSDTFDAGIFSLEREVTEAENEFLKDYIGEWSRLVDTAGVDSSLYDNFEDGMKQVRKAFKSGEPDLKALEDQLFMPIRATIYRSQLRR
jgi:hypothetical protein